MDEQTILEYSKDLTLDFLNTIGASTVDDSHGLYTVTFPTGYESLFGGITKRITFEHSVADVHSCEWVVPGSNFLDIVLGEIKKQAPVIRGRLKKQVESPKECLGNISTRNCHVVLDSFSEEMKQAIRFYFNITVKSIKSISMLRWVDIDLQTLVPLDFPSEIQLDPELGTTTTTYEKQDPRIDHCYSEATKVLQVGIKPLATKYVSMTRDSLTQDLNSLNQAHSRRINEIRDDVSYQKSKLKEFDRKINNARYVETHSKYVADKRKQLERIKKAKSNAKKQIERLTKDKEAQVQQIQKRHRPMIDFSLIAATAYSYSISKCKILLKNKFVEKEIQAEFSEPSKEFTIMCKVCNKQSEKSHLCVNSHLACAFCVNQCVRCDKDVCIDCKDELDPCYICKDGICSDCSAKCHFCNELTCVKHLMTCPHCSETVCFLCSDSCQHCKQRFCDNSINSCKSCEKRVCHDDSQECIECKDLFCPHDRKICAICNGVYCKNDSVNCNFCEQSYSKSCAHDNLCTSCSNLVEVKRESPSVQQVISVDASLQRHKKWEFSENNRYCIFKIKRMLGSNKIIVYDKNLKKILVEKKGGWR